MISPKQKLNRTEIIWELAKHVRSTSPISYHAIIGWPTEVLRALLEWYELPEEKRDGNFGKPIAKSNAGIVVIEVGIDWAEGKDKTVEFQWPFGYAHIDREPLKNKQRFSDVRRKQ